MGLVLTIAATVITVAALSITGYLICTSAAEARASLARIQEYHREARQ